MPPPPAGPIPPYHLFVTAVNDSGGSPVSGATFVLKNIDKSTQASSIVSSETNSNIVLNVADAGAWDTGDSLELDVSFGGEETTEPVMINTSTHPAGRELGTIELEAGSQDAEMTLSMSQGMTPAASKIVDAALTFSQSVGAMQDPDGSASVATTLAQLLGISQSTDGSSSASMTLSQAFALTETGQAATGAALTLSQFVGMRDGSPVEDSVALGVVQSVTFTATAIIVGIITPPGRTVYVKADTSKV